ncbi:MAG: hypothetical protein M1837_005963 [Sclerophora amabilis]|nr:MAG: hypothetical protein M1837_005963 [Sclerophora amabilis]
MAHIRCMQREEPDVWTHKCWGILYTSWGHFESRPEDPPDERLLSLVKTCRQVYHEAIEIIYSDNVFDVKRPDCILFLSSTILPHRLNAIRSLRIHWYFSWPLYVAVPGGRRKHYPPYDEATWERTWEIIADMEGLQYIRVLMDELWMERTPNEVATILEPLKRVPSGKDFEAEIPWRIRVRDIERESPGEPGGCFPFRIKYSPPDRSNERDYAGFTLSTSHEESSLSPV